MKNITKTTRISRLIRFLPLLLFVANAQPPASPVVRKSFDTNDCLQCFEKQDLDSPSSKTYCEISRDNYQCISTDEICFGMTIDWAPECRIVYLGGGVTEHTEPISWTIIIALTVISFLFCAIIVGGIVACVFCCIESGRNQDNPSPQKIIYQQTQQVHRPAEAVLVLPATLTTSAETGLAKEA